MSSSSLTYLSNLLKQKRVEQSVDIEQIIKKSSYKIQSQLISGSLQIQHKLKAEEQLKKLKQQKVKRELQVLNKQIDKNDEIYKEMKREEMRQKKLQHQLNKSIEKQKKRQGLERIKKWNQLQKQIAEKKQVMEKDREKKIQEDEQKIKKEKQEQSQFKKLQKKKQIQQHLRQIQEKKYKREVILKNGEAILQELRPKYIQIEKKFKEFQDQVKFQERILKKNRQLSLKIDHEAIKAHEKEYLIKVEERKANKSPANEQKDEESPPEKQFTQYYSRDQEKIKEEKEKSKRRKQFQEKVKEIPIIIDETKKVKVEIAIDKGKNRLKYNFLGQKALNQFQIFGEFQNFEINVNPRQLGKQYLKELPTLIQNSRITKSQSMSTLRQTEQFQKIQYIDYLQDLKARRSERGERTQQQIKSIIKTHKQKQRAIIQLSERSKRYDLQAKKKGQEMQNLNGIKSVIRKQKEMDEMYLKSIKAKLACLEMNY